MSRYRVYSTLGRLASATALTILAANASAQIIDYSSDDSKPKKNQSLERPVPDAQPRPAKSAEELAREIKKAPHNRDAREALGESYIRKKQYKKAIDLLAPYSNEISNDGLIDLAMAYGKVGDNINEIRVLQLFAEKESDRFRPHHLLGEAYKRSEKFDEAAQSLRQAIQLAPKHLPSYELLLDIFIETKQNYEARTLLTDMIRSFGEKTKFTNLMCKLYSIDNFLKEALSTCKKAISRDPKFPDNHIYLAHTYYNQDNKVAAERIFRTAGRQFPGSEFVQYAAGEYYLNEKNFPTAVRYLQQAVKVNPNTKRSQLTLALALYESKKYADALIHFEKSCRLDKSNESVTILKNSAAKLRQSQENELAAKYDQKAALCQGY